MGKRGHDENKESQNEPKKIKLIDTKDTKQKSMKNVTKISKLKINTICDTIRVRIMRKSTIREWKNERGSGKRFTMDIHDESDKIRCIFFGEAAEKYYEIIELNKIYTISGGLIRKVDEKYPSINDKEIMIPVEANINLDGDNEEENIPEIKFNFKKIQEIMNLPNNTYTDIIAVLVNLDEVEIIYARTGRLLKKRKITLADDSDYEIELTIWNEEAENFEGSKGDIIAFKEIKVNEYNRIKTITMVSTTSKDINPDSTRAKKLKSWYNKINKNKKFRKLEVSDCGNENDPLEGSSKMNV